MAPLLAAIADLGLQGHPARRRHRASPAARCRCAPDCVVVNTEKLEPHPRHRGARVPARRRPRGPGPGPGASRRASSPSAPWSTRRERGLVFATDPTSAWACTIGGNIAENAGGKTACCGAPASTTCSPGASPCRAAAPGRCGGRTTSSARSSPRTRSRFEVRRRGRRAVADASRSPAGRSARRGSGRTSPTRRWAACRGCRRRAPTASSPRPSSSSTRQYDVAADALPGVLRPRHGRGEPGHPRARARLPRPRAGGAQALEHFDDEYVRAIDYKVKAPPRRDAQGGAARSTWSGTPPTQVARGVATHPRPSSQRHANTELFEARDAAEAKRFWADRKKLGAIARRTNAFKLNEDIVLPLDALAEFARFVDALNVEEERDAQVRVLARACATSLEAAPPQEDGDWLAGKLARGPRRCAIAALEELATADEKTVRSPLAPAPPAARSRRAGARLPRGRRRRCVAIAAEVRGRLIVLATHMHAGDGNVHVNIPVLSNDRRHDAAGRGGRRPGHGEGDRARRRRLGRARHRRHQAQVPRAGADRRAGGLPARGRPAGPDEPGQARGPRRPSTTSSRRRSTCWSSRRASSSTASSRSWRSKIAHCVRCGKCKPDCCVFHPARGLFFHPRNKNLAIGALIEALLYDAQRERSAHVRAAALPGGGGRPLHHLPQVPEALPGRHRHRRGLGARARDPRGARATSTRPRATRAHAPLPREPLAGVQRGLPRRRGPARRRAAARRLRGRRAAPARGRAAAGSYALRVLRSPVPRRRRRARCATCSRPARRTRCWSSSPRARRGAPSSTSPAAARSGSTPASRMAALHVLLETGTRVVLPPPFLCCGFPAHANARTEQHGRIVLRDTILFSQIREMFSYLAFDAVVVTCGTCREALERDGGGGDLRRAGRGRGALRPRPGAAPAGAARGSSTTRPATTRSTARPPRCSGSSAASQMEAVPHCCSEAGTLALSRPDITDAMLHRKTEALKEALRTRPAGAMILTNCPSCLQGLGRNAGARRQAAAHRRGPRRAAHRRRLGGRPPPPGLAGEGHPHLTLRRHPLRARPSAPGRDVMAPGGPRPWRTVSSAGSRAGRCRRSWCTSRPRRSPSWTRSRPRAATCSSSRACTRRRCWTCRTRPWEASSRP